MKRPLYQALAQLMDARRACAKRRDATDRPQAERDLGTEWLAKHTQRLRDLVREHMPSGSGIDIGTRIDLGAPEHTLRFELSFHHMDENGSYDGWTEHAVTIRACLTHGFRLTISGPNRNNIKDYLAEVYDAALRAEVES